MCRLSREHGSNGGNTQAVGNETLAGQIASFMEMLHLSFDEVFTRIPYRTLMLMQKDKIHITSGAVVTESRGREVMQRKINR